MNLQNCRINKVYYTTKFNNKTIKITIYGYYRNNKINFRN